METNDHLHSYIFPVVVGTLLFALLAAFIIYFIFVYQRARQKFEWERQQFKQALLQAEVEIRENTLKHVSRELHDNVGQIASLVKINLNLLSTDARETEKQRINESLELVRRMIQDIKALSVSLNKEDLSKLNFTEAIEKDIERINNFETVKIIYTNEIVFPQLKPGVEVFLYRMFQEIMSNMLKHAEATEAKMRIELNRGKLLISFDDNGKGFDREEALNKGSGLANLSERCRIIGATLELDSIREKGTRVRIILPLNQ